VTDTEREKALKEAVYALNRAKEGFNGPGTEHHFAGVEMARDIIWEIGQQRYGWPD